LPKISKEKFWERKRGQGYFLSRAIANYLNKNNKKKKKMKEVK